ncbi:UBC-like protein [Atractiella rhizophila]|nr:UBC-like protein [Atractiella rhizophila]
MVPALKKIARDLTNLARAPSEGIRVCDGWDENLGEDVLCWVEGPKGTAYEGGFFKISFQFGDDFPAAPPKGFFRTKIMHPNVSPSDGAICVSTLKKDWKSTLTIADVLINIKGLMFCPNAESALNEDAGRLMLEDWDAFVGRARMFTSINAIPKEKPVEFRRVKDRVDTSTSASASTSTSASTSATSSMPATSTSTAPLVPPPTSHKKKRGASPIPFPPLPKDAPTSLSLTTSIENGASSPISTMRRRERSTSGQPLVAPAGNGIGTSESETDGMSNAPSVPIRPPSGGFTPIPSPVNSSFPTSAVATPGQENTSTFPSQETGAKGGEDVEMKDTASMSNVTVIAGLVGNGTGRKRTLTSTLVDAVGGSNALKKERRDGGVIGGLRPVIKRRTGLKRL